MNNKELIAELSQRTGLPQSDTRKMVLSTIDELLRQVSEEEVVVVPDFGTFDVKKRVERVITSPSNGKKLLIPPKLVMNFRPVAAWKEQIQKGGGSDE